MKAHELTDKSFGIL